ncbi:hypothetical protein GE09DRAFT_510727 [Coniochaeta sp. 2T2.1]|nr:hypothetical protein GE09DRAFT_510727 [Coniochaeta sp. 2T2.1]
MPYCIFVSFLLLDTKLMVTDVWRCQPWGQRHRQNQRSRAVVWLLSFLTITDFPCGSSPSGLLASRLHTSLADRSLPRTSFLTSRSVLDATQQKQLRFLSPLEFDEEDPIELSERPREAPSTPAADITTPEQLPATTMWTFELSAGRRTG